MEGPRRREGRTLSDPADRPVAIVTGATGGMGRAIVAELVSTHRVIAIARQAEALNELASSCGCEGWCLDVTDFAGYANALTSLDRVDALLHVAASGTPYALEEATTELWNEQFAVNVLAPAELTRLTLPVLRAAGGTVVFIGSGASTNPMPGGTVYAATKHALKGLADSFRLEVADEGIRVTTVSPGPTATDMYRRNSAKAGRPFVPEALIQPESVARAIRFVVDAGPDVQLTDVAVRPRREQR